MQEVHTQFEQNINHIRELHATYVHIVENKYELKAEDILRAEWIYAVSAMDKFIHDLIRARMMLIYQKQKKETPAFLKFEIPISTYFADEQERLSTIETIIIQKHKNISFQQPEKIAEGLSLIWEEEHKWQKISEEMQKNMKEVKTMLKNIIIRRNQIVHEADTSIVSGDKNPISAEDTENVIVFIESLCNAIFKIVNSLD